jgi:DNA-binding MarR family transcriptional regulator
MSEVEAVLDAWTRIHHSFRAHAGRDPETGRRVSAHRTRILSHLDPVDPTMVGELAEHLGVTASTMSLTLKRLESSGLVRRDRDPADRRVTNVRLTEAGVRVRDARTLLDADRVDRVLTSMEPDRRRDALRGLGLLADAADAWQSQSARTVESWLYGEETT